jgi:hypothetical protein
MKRRLRRLIVLFGVIGLVMAFNVGTAFAGHTGQGTAWECTVGDGGDYGIPCPPPTNPDLIGPAAQNAFAPVGSNISDAGLNNGILGEHTPEDILWRNPLCPFHDDFSSP